MLADFSGHAVFSATCYAGAVGTFIRWHVMITPPKAALRASNAMLMLSAVLFVIGTCIAFDGLGYIWLKNQPAQYWIILLVGFATLGWQIDSGSRESQVTLLEAAKQAYDATTETFTADFAEAPLGKKSIEDRTTVYYCYALSYRLPIYGFWLHSRQARQINTPEHRNRHSFQIRDGVPIFREHNGDGYFSNLYVMAHALPAALADLRHKAIPRKSAPKDDANLSGADSEEMRLQL